MSRGVAAWPRRPFLFGAKREFNHVLRVCRLARERVWSVGDAALTPSEENGIIFADLASFAGKILPIWANPAAFIHGRVGRLSCVLFIKSVY